jgi:hypothetical protein
MDTDAGEYAAFIIRVDDENSASSVKMGEYLSPEILVFT